MRRGFGRRRRLGRGGDEGQSAIDLSTLLGRVSDENMIANLALAGPLEPVEGAERYAGLAAVGVGATLDGKPVIVAIAPRNAGDALLAGLAAGSERAKQGDFNGEVLAVAPSWPSSARRLLGLIGKLEYPVRAVSAPGLVDEVGDVEPEPLEVQPVLTVEQIAASIADLDNRSLFSRAAESLGGLASKHGGVVRGSGAALDLVLRARRVALLRADDTGTYLETILPKRATEKLDTEGLAGALDRLEGHLRKTLNDRKLRSGEEGLRASALARMTKAGQVRDIVAWPVGGQDVAPLDFVGVAEDGRPVVGASRVRLNLAALGNILDGVILLRPLLSLVLAEAKAPVRLETPRILLAATEFDSAALEVLGLLALDVTRVSVVRASNGECELIADGDTEARPVPERPGRGPRRGRGRGRGRREDGRREETVAGPAEKPGEAVADRTELPEEAGGDAEFQGISAFDLNEDEPERGRERGRARGRSRGRRPSPAVSATDAEEPGIQEISAFDLQQEERSARGERSERGRGRGRGRGRARHAGESAAEDGDEDKGERSEEPRASKAQERGGRGRTGSKGREKRAKVEIDDEEEGLFGGLSPFDPDMLEIDDEAQGFAFEEEGGEGSGDRQERERAARKQEREAKKELPPKKPRPRRAAILVHNDPDSLVAGILLARDLRILEGFWVYAQDDLMTFFRSVVTDLGDKTPIYIIGFKASPARELIQTASLYSDRLVWFDRHDWPPEDLLSMKNTIGEDNVHVVSGAESVLPAVVAICERRSRFSDKLVDLATGRFTEHDFEHWGRLWHWRLCELAGKTGERRAEIESLLAGRPSDLSKEAEALELPPVPKELEFVGSRDFRVVHFGGYDLVVGEVAQGMGLHLASRILRARYGTTLSLTWLEGEELLVLAGDESSGSRPLDYVSMVENLSEKLEWVQPLASDDHVARFRIAGFSSDSEHLDEVLAEIAMGRSVLEG